MTAIGNLKEPFIEGGIKTPYFFNGRLLTAEALRDQQTADSFHRRQLGRVMGEGVAQGMEINVVTDGTNGTSPTVSITAGLAVNRVGQVVELPRDIRLNLVRKPPAPCVDTGPFAPCKSLDPTLIPTGTGVYILAAAPASGYRGRAPMHHMEDDGEISGCGYKYDVDGVRFKLVYLDITNTSIAKGQTGEKIRVLTNETGPADRSKLRNLLAHMCLGTGQADGFTTHLFSVSGSSAAVSEYGPLDELRKMNCLKSPDVPLALILWTQNGLEFADMWSVRRKVHSPYIYENTPYPKTGRRTAELEAVHLQFQEHMQAILKSTSQTIKAKDYFCYLPSVGVIPLDSNVEADKEYNDITFFDDLSVRDPVFIEGIKLRHLIGASFSYAPIELENEELIWLYRVRQNMQFIEDYPLNKEGRVYLVFSSGYIPFRGEAQYDLSRFDYSNYGPGVAGKFKIGG